MGTDLDGTALMLNVFKRIQKGAPDEFGGALLEELKIEAKECQAICPVDEGTLRDSIHAVGYEREGRMIRAAIVCGEDGSGAEEYAVQQHEDLDLHHEHGEAKFIEKPLMASAPSLASRAGKRVDINRAAGK